jgi:folate-binding Fe-S cluster repair protein YgfZ
MPATRLVDRGVIRVSGDDARDFLDNIVTNALETVTPERAGYGALLTPQGKIIGDFLVVAVPDDEGGGFLLDTPLLQIRRPDEEAEALQAARQSDARRPQRERRR